MPCKNVVKNNVSDSYYHIYARGHARQKIFRDDDDFRFFLNLFKRYLSASPACDKNGRPYSNLHDQIELLAYCLMPNYLHMLVYQVNQDAMANLMKSIMSSYGAYFNKKYKKSGAVFESRYKAARVDNDTHLMYISRYIHLSPGDWQAYLYSSIHAYFGIGQPEWLQPDRIIELFGSTPVYADFLDDYVDYKKSLKEIKKSLANR